MHCLYPLCHKLVKANCIGYLLRWLKTLKRCAQEIHQDLLHKLHVACNVALHVPAEEGSTYFIFVESKVLCSTNFFPKALVFYCTLCVQFDVLQASLGNSAFLLGVCV